MKHIIPCQGIGLALLVLGGFESHYNVLQYKTGDNMNIKNLTLAQKKMLLYVLESDIGMKHTDTEAKENPYTLESRICNQVAKMKKNHESVIYTEYQ